MNQEALKTLTTLCTEVMRCDQFRFKKRIGNLKSRKGDITKPFEKSLKLRQRRFANLPQPQFPDDLPVSSQLLVKPVLVKLLSYLKYVYRLNAVFQA